MTVLVLRALGPGDLLTAFPALRAIARAFPAACTNAESACGRLAAERGVPPAAVVTAAHDLLGPR